MAEGKKGEKRETIKKKKRPRGKGGEMELVFFRMFNHFYHFFESLIFPLEKIKE